MHQCTNCGKNFSTDDLTDIGLLTGCDVDNDIATYECPMCDQKTIQVQLDSIPEDITGDY